MKTPLTMPITAIMQTHRVIGSRIGSANHRRSSIFTTPPLVSRPAIARFPEMPLAREKLPRAAH